MVSGASASLPIFLTLIFFRSSSAFLTFRMKALSARPALCQIWAPEVQDLHFWSFSWAFNPRFESLEELGAFLSTRWLHSPNFIYSEVDKFESKIVRSAPLTGSAQQTPLASSLLAGGCVDSIARVGEHWMPAIVWQEIAALKRSQ